MRALQFYILAKVFMIGSKARRELKSLNFQADNLLIWHNHNLSTGGRRKTFECALTHDLLQIQKFSVFPNKFLSVK